MPSSDQSPTVGAGVPAVTPSAARRKPKRANQLGVTDAEYAAMLERQGGGCAICGARPKTRRLHVDHDHASGKVRGLLCHRCNRNLGTWVTVKWCCVASFYLSSGYESARRYADSMNEDGSPA